MDEGLRRIRFGAQQHRLLFTILRHRPLMSLDPRGELLQRRIKVAVVFGQVTLLRRRALVRRDIQNFPHRAGQQRTLHSSLPLQLLHHQVRLNVSRPFRFEPRLLQLPRLLRARKRLAPAGSGSRHIDFLRRVKESVELVKLTLRDRIILVGMTFRAGHGESQPGRGCGRDAIHPGFALELRLVHAVFKIRERHAMKAGGDLLLHRRLRQQVARELLDGELIERLIAVKGIDDPVAIEVGPGPDAIDLIARAVRVTRQVEPVAAPALAKMRRRQHRFHQPLAGIAPPVIHESVHLLNIGRQPQQIQIEPADERGPIRLRRRLETFLFQPPEHEVVDGIAHPFRIFYAGNIRTAYRLETPMPRRPLIGVRELSRPGCAGINPRANDRDLVGGETFALGRHQLPGVGRGEPLHQRTGRAVADHDRRPARIAARQRDEPVIQPVAALLLFRAVAFQAVLGKNRKYIACGINGPGRRKRRQPKPKRQDERASQW